MKKWFWTALALLVGIVAALAAGDVEARPGGKVADLSHALRAIAKDVAGEAQGGTIFLGQVRAIPEGRFPQGPDRHVRAQLKAELEALEVPVRTRPGAFKYALEVTYSPEQRFVDEGSWKRGSGRDPRVVVIFRALLRDRNGNVHGSFSGTTTSLQKTEDPFEDRGHAVEHGDDVLELIGQGYKLNPDSYRKDDSPVPPEQVPHLRYDPKQLGSDKAKPTYRAGPASGLRIEDSRVCGELASVGVLVDGKLAVVERDGNDFWFKIPKGKHFEIDVLNHQKTYELALGVKIDGVSSFQFADKSIPRKQVPSAHLVAPAKRQGTAVRPGRRTIRGWWKSPKISARFLVGDFKGSAADLLGLPQEGASVGTITVAVRLAWKQGQAAPQVVRSHGAKGVGAGVHVGKEIHVQKRTVPRQLTAVLERISLRYDTGE